MCVPPDDAHSGANGAVPTGGIHDRPGQAAGADGAAAVEAALPHLGAQLRKSDSIMTTVDVLNDQLSTARGLPAEIPSKADPEKFDLARLESGSSSLRRRRRPRTATECGCRTRATSRPSAASRIARRTVGWMRRCS